MKRCQRHTVRSGRVWGINKYWLVYQHHKQSGCVCLNILNPIPHGCPIHDPGMFAAKTRPMREWNIAKSNKPIQISHPQSSHQNNWAVTDIPIEPRTREILLTLGNGFSPWIMMDYDNPQLLLYCLYNHRLINSATFSMAKCRFVVVVTPTACLLLPVDIYQSIGPWGSIEEQEPSTDVADCQVMCLVFL